jgi:hypothetical protein
MRLKSQLYSNEQDCVINKIINILDITTENNTITLYDIDNNETMKQKLMDLIPEIRKWFSFAHINPISNPDKYKRPYISILRQIPKKHYEFSQKEIGMTVNGKFIRTQQYIFKKRT